MAGLQEWSACLGGRLARAHLLRYSIKGVTRLSLLSVSHSFEGEEGKGGRQLSIEKLLIAWQLVLASAWNGSASQNKSL